MKKIGVFFLLISALGYGEITYDDGKVKLDTKMVDGKIISYDLNNDGKEFNGRLEIKGNNQRGVFFYENGILKKEENYSALSDKIPSITTYYDNGQTKETVAFFGDSYRKSTFYPNGNMRYWGDLDLNKQENGRIVEHYDNGVIKSIFTYINGNLDGEYMRFARTGKLMEKGVIHEKKTVNEFFDDYDILYEDKTQKLGLQFEGGVEYVINLTTNEKFTGKISLQKYNDFLNKYITYEAEFKEGLLNGKVVTKENYGVVTENYKNGKLDGESIVKFDDGGESVTLYKDGEELEFYREDKGIINSKIQYKYGLTHGNMEIYNDEGNLTMLQEYKFGKENGKRILYGADGKIALESKYVLGIELEEKERPKVSLENAILIGNNEIYSYKEVKKIQNEVNREIREKLQKYFRIIISDETDITMAKVYIDNEGKFVRKSHYTVPEIFSDVEVEERRGYEPLIDFYLILKDESERETFRERFFNLINDLNIDDSVGLNLMIIRKNTDGESYDAWLYSNNLGYNLGSFNVESRYIKNKDVFILRDLKKDKIIERINLDKKGHEESE